MMNAVLFLIILTLTFLVFFVPKAYKYQYTLLLLMGAIALSSVWCFKVLSGSCQVLDIHLELPAFGNSLILIIDKLSAFFIVVVNITVFVGLLYAKGYLKPYQQTKNSLSFSIHFLSYLWLYLSMIMVVMIRDGLTFLIVWELMALSSFLLVIFEAEDRTILKTGINYLIQMHVGMFFILIAFLMVGKATGEMSFDALGLYFSNHSDFLLFILFFIGFGIKAGFIPLHTWLPEAHPAAPSHVSGVMSGVMIKMGIYGILRVLISVQNDLLLIGITILVISLMSGILGVMMAIVQHDLKRLLAYHSIENIGIIGIGIGLGVIGLATNDTTLSLLGFSGGLLHVLNHSLFKSLLFFNAGSVYHAIHTRNIEQMGGLIKKMPYTAILFLIGSLAICGLPPFNGFISEYLIYIGMFKSLSVTNLYQSIIILGSIVGLSLIGGLAIFCFTKAFGIVFLGEPRSEKAKTAKEVSRDMIIPQYITIAFIVIIGLASVLFVKPVFNIISQTFSLPDITNVTNAFVSNLVQISLLCGIFVITVVALLVYRHYHLKSRKVSYGPTWGCGYTAGTSKQEYTATSYAYNYNHIAKPVLQTKKIMKDIREDEIFPDERTFKSHSDDIFKKLFIDKPVDWISDLLKKIAVMQTGQIQHYILYAFVYLLLVFLLTYFNII
ncbi:MAG: NADH-quinone oxidoreductase subunit E [Bacteroidales bacterium]|nr:NADH-quinone oxidoreductase subunit E [Bacteroidales bacterium]